jgi:hypothetical protein
MLGIRGAGNHRGIPDFLKIAMAPAPHGKNPRKRTPEMHLAVTL